MWVKGIENVVEERRWKARRISFDTKHKMLWYNSSKRDDGIHTKKENTLHNPIEEKQKKGGTNSQFDTE